ncbi:MAG: N-acetylmuramoyl-L-alanine amidase [Verrucomicrobiota bacterium]|nr:N-acetylmuramoyl-L-alanine amidase [Verrucomicrobiota bacterium]
MIRTRVFLGTIVTLAAILGAFVHAQSADPEKKKKAREEMRAVTSPTPSETPEPTAKPKPAKRKTKTKTKATPTPTAKPKPKKTPANGDNEEASSTPKPKASKSPGKKSGDEDEDVTPKPKAKASETPASKKSPKAEADKSATPKKKAESEKETPKPQPFSSPAEASPVPRPAPRPTLRPVPPQSSLPSDITVEKSGIEQEQGFEPPPPPPPVKRSWWPFSRPPANYRYLTAANIDAIRRAPVQRARWKFVIVHNSGTRQGSAKVFDYYHRRVRRMKNGLAYHFVIGNGTSTRNGQIEIGDRWVRQTRGGHVHSDYMNNIGLGICLVGDFNRDQPTRAQLEACEELIKYLQERCGKMTVRPHREVNPPRWATDCPGDVFPYGWFGRFR